jgi:hypothetical protein
LCAQQWGGFREDSRKFERHTPFQAAAKEAIRRPGALAVRTNWARRPMGGRAANADSAFIADNRFFAPFIGPKAADNAQTYPFFLPGCRVYRKVFEARVV